MAEKERAVVWGIGYEYLQNKEKIESRFEIVAYVDRKFEDKKKLGEREVRPSEIKRYSWDKILITSYRYFDSIRVQLVRIGVDIDKIYDLSILEEKENRDFLQVVQDINKYEQLNSNSDFSIDLDNLKLISEDRCMAAGAPAAHYFAQDIWGANKIFKNKPKIHYDIGSKLDGFIAHLLVFREVNYIDIRPLPFEIPNLHFTQGDATNLRQFEDNSIESISSFHAIEHFGLGRYGDEIDPDAYLKVIKNIQRVVKRGGVCYIGVPIGPKDRLVFNAHRIFSINTIIKLFDKMTLRDIAIVNPTNTYAEVITESEYSMIEDYSCGLFEFVKK